MDSEALQQVLHLVETKRIRRVKTNLCLGHCAVSIRISSTPSRPRATVPSHHRLWNLPRQTPKPAVAQQVGYYCPRPNSDTSLSIETGFVHAVRPIEQVQKPLLNGQIEVRELNCVLLVVYEIPLTRETSSGKKSPNASGHNDTHCPPRRDTPVSLPCQLCSSLMRGHSHERSPARPNRARTLR